MRPPKPQPLQSRKQWERIDGQKTRIPLREAGCVGKSVWFRHQIGYRSHRRLCPTPAACMCRCQSESSKARCNDCPKSLLMSPASVGFLFPNSLMPAPELQAKRLLVLILHWIRALSNWSAASALCRESRQFSIADPGSKLGGRVEEKVRLI